jgi:hypothetical protein
MAKADPPAGSGDTVIPLNVESGDVSDQDERVFSLATTVGGLDAQMIWGCGGHTIITESLATKLRLTLKPNPEQAPFRDPQGEPLFLGNGTTTVEIAGNPHLVDAWVMHDGAYLKGDTGFIGHEIAAKYQWEMDPRVPRLTLRDPGAKLPHRPLITLPLKDHDLQIWINIKIRNEPVDVALIPQTPDVQANGDLQNRWDLVSGHMEETPSYMGNVRVKMLRGVDGAYFGHNLFEPNIRVMLLPVDNPAAQSGIGQSLLNRFVYCVDAEKGEFYIMDRLGQPTSRPTTQTATAPAPR